MSRPLLPVAALAAALAACGGDEKAGGGGPPVTVPSGGEVRVVADEYSFKPSNVVVTGDKKLRLTLENRGSLAHDLRLVRDGRQVGGIQPFQGGKARSATVQVGPGNYTMICSVGNHEELGMKGSLEVR